MNRIEDARIDDLPALVELLTDLFTQEADFQPDAERQARGLRAILDQPQLGRILVARDEHGRALGMVILLTTVSTAVGGRVALLEDMVVTPHARNQGIGSALLRHAITLADSEGCLRITLLTDHTNTAAIRFYQRHGFTLSHMTPLRRSLQ